MASLFQRLRAAVGRAFPGKPKSPKVERQSSMGHRGIAAGKLPSFQGEQDAQKVDAKVRENEDELVRMRRVGATQTEINAQVARIEKLERQANKLRNPQKFEKYGGTGKWRTLASDTVAEFVYDAQPLFLHSSNVAMAQFFNDTNKLMVEFLNGSAYLYSNVSEQEAIELAQAQSKGSWVWTNLRVRGSKTKHRKPYVRIR